MTGNAKVASLPHAIREQVNRRLQNGQAGRQIVEWLNTLSGVKGLMAAEFAGQPVSEENLASWKDGGYRAWEAQQEALEAVRQFGADAAELAQAAGGQLADQLALCLTARIAVALRQPASGGDDSEKQLHRLRELCSDLVALRKGDHNAQWLRIEREKLEADLKKFAEEEAARQRETEKPNIDFKTYHASPETHARVAEALRNL